MHLLLCQRYRILDKCKGMVHLYGATCKYLDYYSFVNPGGMEG